MKKVSKYVCRSVQSFERLSYFVQTVRGASMAHQTGRDGEITVQISAVDMNAWERVFLRAVKDPDIVGVDNI